MKMWKGATICLTDTGSPEVTQKHRYNTAIWENQRLCG
jgi:hypothetical protein